jgi:aryl-alcohol dehydrogenase-like predicted oxidoreductase
MTETLRTAELGRTGLQITRVGFGAWAIGGGGWEFGWGPQDDDQSIAAVHRALELGVNWIDTAAAYGFGRSEEVVGRALQGVAARPYVFTKCSLVEGPGRSVVHDLSRDSVLREAEASLNRLGIDAIDLRQIHWPMPEPQIERGWSALAELKDRDWCAIRVAVQLRCRPAAPDPRIAPVETLQPPYSLVARQVEGEDPAVRRTGERRRDRLLADGSGLLTGRMTGSASRQCPTTTGASVTRGSRAAAVRHLGLVARLDRRAAARHHPGRESRSRGPCATRPSTRRSSASADRIRSTRCPRPPDLDLTATRTSPRSGAATDEHAA